MLTRLHISNYALIDQLVIDFHSGLTIITGETGAGKSIILGALSLILGERADLRGIRNKSSKTVVEAVFDIAGYHLEAFFKENDIDFFEKECIVRREMSASGRSRIFVNDTPVNMTLLKDLTSKLVDIHSQHSNMLLSKPQFQLAVLDNLAGNAERLVKYQQEYCRMKDLQSQLRQLEEEFNTSKAEEDYVRFQLRQLEELKLMPNEDEELESLQNKLSNVTDTKEALWRVETALNGEENSIIAQLSAVTQHLSLAERSLKEISGMSERVRSSMIELKDVAETLSSMSDTLIDDPARLQQVEERLSAIYELEHKHNVDSVNALLEIQGRFQRKIDDIDNSDERMRQVQALLDEQGKVVSNLAAQLTSARKKSAREFVSALKPHAKSLGMKNLEFSIDFKSIGLTSQGGDAIEFLFSFNKNQPLMPVKNTASGGEISRLMLCIKAIIARNMNLPTIIFDEIDTGVSGDMANRIGDVMGEIAQRIQVIAITHLPQVAAHAVNHLMVYKTDTHDTTLTGVRTLHHDEHVLEIARMLSGSRVNQAAIDNAKSLINLSK